MTIWVLLHGIVSKRIVGSSVGQNSHWCCIRSDAQSSKSIQCWFGKAPCSYYSSSNLINTYTDSDISVLSPASHGVQGHTNHYLLRRLFGTIFAFSRIFRVSSTAKYEHGYSTISVHLYPNLTSCKYGSISSCSQ